jgi:hypothetical protein
MEKSAVKILRLEYLKIVRESLNFHMHRDWKLLIPIFSRPPPSPHFRPSPKLNPMLIGLGPLGGRVRDGLVEKVEFGSLNSKRIIGSRSAKAGRCGWNL